MEGYFVLEKIKENYGKPISWLVMVMHVTIILTSCTLTRSMLWIQSQLGCSALICDIWELAM